MIDFFKRAHTYRFKIHAKQNNQRYFSKIKRAIELKPKFGLIGNSSKFLFRLNQSQCILVRWLWISRYLWQAKQCNNQKYFFFACVAWEKQKQIRFIVCAFVPFGLAVLNCIWDDNNQLRTWCVFIQIFFHFGFCCCFSATLFDTTLKLNQSLVLFALLLSLFYRIKLTSALFAISVWIPVYIESNILFGHGTINFGLWIVMKSDPYTHVKTIILNQTKQWYGNNGKLFVIFFVLFRFSIWKRVFLKQNYEQLFIQLFILMDGSVQIIHTNFVVIALHCKKRTSRFAFVPIRGCLSILIEAYNKWIFSLNFFSFRGRTSKSSCYTIQ